MTTITTTTAISPEEFHQRMRAFQANIKAAGLDAALVHGNESDFANVRYLSEYWPTFEAAAVFVPAEGEAVLIIGPESETYARGRSVIQNIEKMVEYRESAEPDYPGIAVASFRDVADKAMPGKALRKLGIVGHSITTLPVYEALRRDLPDAELVNAGDTLFADEICCGHWEELRAFDRDATLFDLGVVLRAGESASETKAWVAESPPRAVWEESGDLRAIELTGADGVRYRVAANFGGAEQKVPMGEDGGAAEALAGFTRSGHEEGDWVLAAGHVGLARRHAPVKL